MKRYKLTLSNGASAFGVSLGRRHWLPCNSNARVKLHLTRMRMVDGGAYDTGGAYWGANLANAGDMYCAEGFYEDGYPDIGETVRLFVRAHDRADARAQVLKVLPNARFYR